MCWPTFSKMKQQQSLSLSPSLLDLFYLFRKIFKLPKNYLATKYGKYQQYERGNLPAAVAAVQTRSMSAGRQQVLTRKVEKNVVNLATLATQKGIGVSR